MKHWDGARIELSKVRLGKVEMEENNQSLNSNPPVIPDLIRDPENSPRPKSKLPLIIIGIIILVSLFAGSAAGFYVYKQQLLKNSQKPIYQPVVQKQLPSPTLGSTADWKLYESDEFSFKYPKGWNFEDFFKKYPNENEYMKKYVLYEYFPNLNQRIHDVLITVKTGSLGSGTAGFKGDLNTPLSEFFNTKSNLWLIGNVGGGGPGTTYEIPIETSIGGKRAILHSSHPSTEYEFANPDQITNGYIIPINGSLKNIVYISIFYSNSNPKKEKLLADFNQLLSTFKFTN